MTLVIFTEEQSMKATLEALLPRLGAARGTWRVIAFDGAGELERQLPRQLPALREGGDKVLILRDNDNRDCTARKTGLSRMAAENGPPRAVVRIVCQMLEAWFIGDSAAFARSGLVREDSIPRKLRTCDPDALRNPKQDLRRLRPDYNPITGAQRIAPHLSLDRNRSASFRATVAALRAMIAGEGGAR